MATIGKLAVGLAIGYALITLIAYLAQRRLMYFPSSERIPPAAVGLHAVEEIVLETPDGERVLAWHAKARPGQPTLLYFHGNGGNLAIRAERFRRFLERGRGVFMMSYRGYSGSTGSPSESANVSDAQLAYRVLTAAGVRPHDIILYGESLGSGIATRVAIETPVAGLILESPYTSAVDVGVRQYPFLPVRLLMQDRYDIIGRIGEVRVPVLVIHGERDEVVPYDMGQAVFAAAPEPKELASFPEAGHNDHAMHGSHRAIEGWIDRLRAGRLQGTTRKGR